MQNAPGLADSDGQVSQKVTGASTFDPESAEVRAAGGVVYRSGRDGGVEVAVAHRPRYDDWTLPKGKLDPGENWKTAALREVREEIGARCSLGRELSPISYTDGRGRSKAVRYWVMRAERVDFIPNEEVDAVRWMAPADALALLTYPRDRGVVEEAAL